MQHFFRHTIIYTISTLLVRGISLLLLPLFTKYLAPKDYGVVDLINVFGAFILVFLGVETYQGIARHIAAYNDKKEKQILVSSVCCFLIVTYLLFFILANIFHYYLFSWILPLQSAFLLNLVIIGYLAQAIIVNIQATLKYDLQVQKSVIASIVVSLCVMFFNVLFIIYLHLGLKGAVYGLVLGNVCGLCYTLYAARSYLILKINLSNLIETLKFTYPLAISALFTVIMLYIDRVTLNKILGLHDVGLFGVAYRIASIINLTMVGVQGALGPLIYTNINNAETPTNLVRLFEKFLLVAILFVIVIALFAPEILHIVANSKYYQAAGLIKFLVISMLMANLYMFFPGMNIKKDTHIIMYINIIGAALNLILNIILIKLFGLIGSAIATLTSYTLFLLLFIYFSQKRYYLPLNKEYILKNILFGLIMLIITGFINVVDTKMFVIKLLLLLLFMSGIVVLNLKRLNIKNMFVLNQ